MNISESEEKERFLVENAGFLRLYSTNVNFRRSTNITGPFHLNSSTCADGFLESGDVKVVVDLGERSRRLVATVSEQSRKARRCAQFPGFAVWLSTISFVRRNSFSFRDLESSSFRISAVIFDVIDP
jgi:hypothetical protein